MAVALQFGGDDGRDSIVMRAPGDRRARLRFEVFGSFWGTLDAEDPVRLRNLTRHGALIETIQPLAVESVQSVCLMLDGQPAIADARVCYLADTETPAGQRYLVGVEFLPSSSAFAEAVDRLIAYRSSSAELA